MSEQPDPAKHLQLRASDADRERVAQFLHTAMSEGRLTLAELDERLQTVYAAKTLGELVPVTADLPGMNSPITAPSSQPINRIGGVPDSSVLIGMMSGFHRQGEWVVPRYQTAIAILGGGKLDLTEARFAERECTIQVFALMGGVEIIVPEDITVHARGIGLMGGFDRGTVGTGEPGAPILRVTGLAIMGGVDIRRRRGHRRDPLTS